MHILLVSHIWPPAVDGGSKIIYKTGQFLSKDNSILTITSNCQLSDDFVKAKYFSLPSSSDIIRLPIYRSHRRLPKPLFKIIPLISAISKIIKFQPDLTIAGPFPTTISLYAYLFKLITHSKLLLLPCYHEKDREFHQPLLNYVLKKSDYIWALTEHEKRFYPKKSFALYPGVDQSFLIKKKIIFPKIPHIIFIGNFAAHKRVDLLVKVCQKLKIKLTLLGQITLYYPKLSKILDKNIKVIIKPTQLQIKKAIDSATCLCLPSNQESFGLVFIESLARGKPVIGADIPPVREIIEKTNGGLVFKKDDFNSLLKSIKKITTNQRLAKKLGQNGFEYIKNNLTWDRIGNSLIDKL